MSKMTRHVISSLPTPFKLPLATQKKGFCPETHRGAADVPLLRDRPLACSDQQCGPIRSVEALPSERVDDVVVVGERRDGGQGLDSIANLRGGGDS